MQDLLKKNRNKPRRYLNKRYGFELTGLVRCGCCGKLMTGKSAHGSSGKIPYYEHGWSQKQQAFSQERKFLCKPYRVQAKKLEPHVWQKITSLLSNPTIAENLLKRARELHGSSAAILEEEKLKKRIVDTKLKLESLAEHLSRIPKEVSADPIFKQMQKLELEKNLLEAQLADFRKENSPSDMPSSLSDYRSLCRFLRDNFNTEASAEIKSQITRTLVHKIEIQQNSYKIFFYTGSEIIQQNIKSFQTLKKVSGDSLEGIQLASSDLEKVQSSKRLTIGDLTPT
ncbi:MAG: zinc ribbon domain-containing protein [Bdellovibrio sp.]